MQGAGPTGSCRIRTQNLPPSRRDPGARTSIGIVAGATFGLNSRGTDDATLPASMVTREELREELARYPTREELRKTLRQELARYPTREELREELARIPTREELCEGLGAVREEGAQASAELRRYMEILYENHQETLRTVLETLVSRMDRLEVQLGGRVDDHEQRLTGAENRLARLEHERKH